MPAGNGFPAYGNCPVDVFCTANSESSEFSTDTMSNVDTATAGTAMAMSNRIHTRQLNLIFSLRMVDKRRTARPNNPIPLRAVHKRRRTLGDCVVVVPCHVGRVGNGRVDFKDVNQRVPVRGRNGAHLIRVCACIPYAI
jgi:hypothetical protein